MRTRVTLILALALTWIIAEPTAAQEPIPLPCGGESVSGVVVAVDAGTGTVTLNTGVGLCTVTLDGEYGHPIVGLLGVYFGDVSIADLAAALKATQGCAVYDPDSDTWAWADCAVAGAVPATIIAENEDGAFTAIITVDGEPVAVAVTVDDPAAAEGLSEALQTLTAEDWKLNEDGAVLQASDEIAAYHEEGMGFGVLAKLYAMAAEWQETCVAVGSAEPCAVTAAELVEAFQSGTGMGQLFKEYGKPAILGVGHVKQQTKDEEHGNGGGPPPHAGPKDDRTTGPPPHAGPKKPKNK